MTPGKVTGSRNGWWGLNEASEAFLDQIITCDLGFHFAYHRPDHNIQFTPEWAQMTLTEHANDPRPSYVFDELENAETHDEIWNAAQRELRETELFTTIYDVMGESLRMGTDPVTASDWMVRLNDRGL